MIWVVRGVTPICSSDVYKSGDVRGAPANVVCAHHQPELCSLPSELAHSVAGRDFCAIEQNEKSWTLKSLEALSANIKTSISVENCMFKSNERIWFVEKGFIGPEYIFSGQDSFSHVEVMRKDFLLFLFLFRWL